MGAAEVRDFCCKSCRDLMSCVRDNMLTFHNRKEKDKMKERTLTRSSISRHFGEGSVLRGSPSRIVCFVLTILRDEVPTLRRMNANPSNQTLVVKGVTAAKMHTIQESLSKRGLCR